MSRNWHTLVALSLTLTPVSALADDATQEEREEREISSADDQYRNVFTVKFGHLYAANRPRTSEAGGHTPEAEHMLGLVPSYGRTLIPGRLTFEIAFPFFANLDRFDTPLDLTLIFPFRFGRFEPYFALGGTFNLKIFPGERGEAEGTDVEFAAGFTSGVGLAYIINRRWLFEVELTYAWIPSSEIVEHELAQLAGFGYMF